MNDTQSIWGEWHRKRWERQVGSRTQGVCWAMCGIMAIIFKWKGKPFDGFKQEGNKTFCALKLSYWLLCGKGN